MEDFQVTIILDPRSDLLTELVKVSLALEQEAERHARVQHRHMDGTSLLPTVVQASLGADVFREIYLRIDIMWVEENKSICVIIFRLRRALEAI